MPQLRVLTLRGSHYEMGFQHGQAFTDEIRALTAERVHLSCDPTWTGRNLSKERVLELAENCIPYHQDYAPDIMQQLQGIADATGLSIAELIIANGFTDLADTIYNALETEASVPHMGNECTAWLTTKAQSRDGQTILAQNWDMHATATPHVIMIHGIPNDEPEFFAFTLTGCVAMIGMNSAGIAVGINNLSGADGQVGVTWNFVSRKILQQTTIEDALKCITDAHLAGGHNYLLMDAHGRGYNVEAMATRIHITELQDEPLVHANMCLHDETRAVERPFTDAMTEDSVTRARRAQQYLNAQKIFSETDMMHIMRSREDAQYSVCVMPEAPFYSETCGSVIMKPATREFWGLWGLPTENEYEYFKLSPQ